MTAGLMFPSYGAEAAWSPVAGAWSANYPLSNVGSKVEIEQVARAVASGAIAIGGVLPAARVIGGVALIGHNVPAGSATVRVRVFSGPGHDPVANSATMVFDSGDERVWPAGTGPVLNYRSIRPIILPLSVTGRSVLIDISAFGQPLQLGAIEVSGFWEWPGVSLGREQGFDGEAAALSLVGGGVHVDSDARPRIVSAQVDLLDMKVTETTGLDFQAITDTVEPFVWCEDFDDPTIWARKCLLARNQSLPRIVGRLYRHDAFPLRLVEHTR